MPTSKKPRKRYRPSSQTLAQKAQAYKTAIEGVQKLTEEEKGAGIGVPESAFQAFADGKGDPEHYAVLADAFNVAESLCDVGICSDDYSRSTISEGEQALLRLHRQHEVLGIWALWPADTCALSAALQTCRTQLEHCDYSEYCRAVERTKRRIRGALAGAMSPGVLMVNAERGNFVR